MARTPTELTPYTIEDLEHLAGRLRSYAEKYESIAESLASIGEKTLGIPNQKTLNAAMNGLRTHFGESEVALSEVLDLAPSRRKSAESVSQAAEPAELYLTPVGKGKTKPTITSKTDAKSDSGTKKRAE